MSRGRLEAFSDGVIAILITIMVLELRPPTGPHLSDLHEVVPKFLAYVLSFVFIAIYWNNHHHMMHAVERVDGRVLWANMHLLFWISLIPFTTAWMGEHARQTTPVAAYGVIFLGAAGAWYLLTHALLAVHDGSSTLATAIGNDRKGKLSLVGYVVAIACAFVWTWLAIAIYVLVAVVWLVPDRRITRVLGDTA